MDGLLRKFYYLVKPIVPRRIQLFLRRVYVLKRLGESVHVWPIDARAGEPPECWTGWPDGKRFALILTHDVDTARGRDRVLELASMERRLGFRSSFNFVPGKYHTPEEMRKKLVEMDFEVGVHGLTHDGKLYSSRRTFEERAGRINDYLRKWGSVGFRSPAMHHNLAWIGELEIEYDSSTFDTDPFEPQPDGVSTIFPFIVKVESNGREYVEMPYTLPQDFTLFILMGEKDCRIWREKLRWICERGGMALLNTHPDYMNFGGRRRFEEYPVEIYENFLNEVRNEYGDTFWNPLPRELAEFWRKTQTNRRIVK